MKTAVLVTPLTVTIPIIKDADYIGVDAGCIKILKQGLKLAFGVGDFDSMDPETFEKMKNISNLVIHPVRKNETDSELALEICQKKGYERLILCGGLHGRIDHTIANIRLLMYRFPNLILEDDHQRIYYLSKGDHVLKKNSTHISFFAVEKTVVTLKGFAYPLDKYTVYPKDILTVSNEIVEESARVEVHQGSLLCVETDIQ